MPIVCAKSTNELTVPNHFYRGSRSARWYVRLVAPSSVRHLVPQPDYRQSTGQTDLRKAKALGAALIAEKRREWDSLERQVAADGGIGHYAVATVLTAPVIDKICAARLYASMQVDEKARVQGLHEEELAEIEQFCAMTDKAMRSVLSQGKASPRWTQAVESLVMWSETCGHIVDRTDPLFPKLVRDYAAVEKEACARILARNQGDESPTPSLPAYRPPTLSLLTEEFRAYKAQKSKRPHVDACVNAWMLFVAHCGDVLFDSVTPSHIYDFLQARMHATEKPWSEARALQFGRSVLREAFGLARVRNLMTKPNPVDGMEVVPTLSSEEEAAHRRPRYPFTGDQLNKLFASSWFEPANRSHFRGKMLTDLAARYWVPLIGLFHGNRVREALQLAASDFYWDGDVLILSFQTELDFNEGERDTSSPAAFLESLRSLKNAATRRVVPVHPALLSLGFAEFIEQRRGEGATSLLFPSSLPEPGGERPKLGRAYEQAFLRYVRDRLGFGSGYGNHSFRHQLEDRIRGAQNVRDRWPPGLAQQYVGRKRTRDSDREILMSEGSEAAYGRGYPASVVRQWAGTLDFTDVTIPPPYTAWLRQQ